MRDITAEIFIISIIGIIIFTAISLYYIQIMSKNECNLFLTNSTLYNEYEQRVKIIGKVILFFAISFSMTMIDTMFIYVPK